MGCSPDGFLLFGIDFGAREEREPELELPNDLDDLIYQHYRGADDPPRPVAEYPDLGQAWRGDARDATPEEQALCDAYSAYWDAKRRVSAEVGIGLLLTGTDGCSGDVLFIDDSRLSVEWTDTADAGAHLEQFADGSLKGWRDVLSTFCRKSGIPFTEPKWLLATRYF